MVAPPSTCLNSAAVPLAATRTRSARIATALPRRTRRAPRQPALEAVGPAREVRVEPACKAAPVTDGDVAAATPTTVAASAASIPAAAALAGTATGACTATPAALAPASPASASNGTQGGRDRLRDDLANLLMRHVTPSTSSTASPTAIASTSAAAAPSHDGRGTAAAVVPQQAAPRRVHRENGACRLPLAARAAVPRRLRGRGERRGACRAQRSAVRGGEARRRSSA